MASAGTVTIDFAAETAKFTAELKKVRSDLKGLKDDVTGINKFFSGLATGFKAFVGLGTATAAIAAVTKATAESEAAVSQLNSALKNAGGTAGVTSRELQDFAAQMQRVTTFTDEAVIGVESILLSFKGLSGETVLKATQAVLDLSTRLKVDLTAAAKLVGRALADPEKGLTALGRAGVVFSKSQKEIIKGLVETGDVAGAQARILGELEARMGGAAQAARGSFAGALSAVKNAFGDLLEAKSGVPTLTSSLNELAKVLSDPSTKAAFDSLLSFLSETIALAVKAATGITQVFTALQPKTDAARIDLIDQQIIQLTQNMKVFVAGSAAFIDANEKILELERQRAALQGGTIRGGPSTRRAPRIGETADEAAPDFTFLDKALARQAQALEFRRKIANEEFEQQSKIFEEQGKLEQKRAEESLSLATSISHQKLAIALNEFNEQGKLLEEQAAREKAFNQTRVELNSRIADQVVGILAQLGTRSKAFAVAALVAETAIAAVRILAFGQVAAFNALAQLGPVAGPPVAASIVAASRLSAALVAASGAISIAQTLSSNRGGFGGGSFGSVTNPVITQPTGQLPARETGGVQVFITGVVTNDVIQQLLDGLEDQFDRDVIVINQGTAQHQSLTGGP